MLDIPSRNPRVQEEQKAYQEVLDSDILNWFLNFLNKKNIARDNVKPRHMALVIW